MDYNDLLYIPDWSDLGPISESTRGDWESELAVRQNYQSYYDGGIFKERIPTEQGSGDQAPLLYPVGINLVKMLCNSQADSMFGEWDEDIVSFEPPQNEQTDETSKDAANLTREILRFSSANTLLWEMEVDRNLFGGSVLMVRPEMQAPHIRWSRIPLNSFFPVYDPEDTDRLLQVYIYTVLSAEQAFVKYGISESSSTQGIVRRVERWTLRDHKVWFEGKLSINEPNPYATIPFVFIPRLRTAYWWGDPLTAEVIPVQDELNMRLGDLGEAINYNTHPVRWGINLNKAFKTENFPIGPNILWDLGRVVGNSPEPKVGILEAQNPVPQGTQEYIKFLYDWSRTSVSAPPIAFGEDNGGGQRSGITLEIRMWPLIKAVRRSRSYMAAGLLRAMSISAKILAQRQFSDGPSQDVLRLLDQNRLVPRFANLMPRDQAALVDEVVKRLSTTPPTISLESSVKKLGDGTAEVTRILDMLANDKLYERQIMQKPLQPGQPDGRANATRPTVP